MSEDTPEPTDDQRRAQGLPPEPRPAGEERAPVTPPKPVDVSFWLWIGAGLLYIAGYALIVIDPQPTKDAFVKSNRDPNISKEMIESGVTSLMWTLLIGAAVFAVLFALFAYKAREGTRSARAVLTGLAVVTVAIQLMLPISTLLSLVGALLALAAMALLYLPSVADYFPKVPKKLPR